MKRFKDLRPLREDFDAKEMEIANKTSRSAGAVSSKALVPRHIEQHGNKEIDEEIQIDEISDTTLASYKEKAKKSAEELEAQKKFGPALKRRIGILSATGKMVGRAGEKIGQLAKEEIESLDEINYAGWSFDDLHKHLKKNGWDLDRSTGHKQYVHPKSSRPIAVPHKHGKTVAPGTVRNIHQKMKEFIQEENETAQKEEMALTKLHFVKYAAEEIIEYIKMGGHIEEWYQVKLSKLHGEMEGLHSYIEGEKRRTGMVKEEEVPTTTQQDNLTLASRTLKEKPNKEPMHKYSKEKVEEATYLVKVQHHDKEGQKGEKTHKIFNVTDPVRPELHAKNIAMMRHKKWAETQGIKLDQYMPIETKKLDESRKLEIVKEIVKKKNETKLKSGDSFQPEPVLSSDIVKET